MELLLFLLAILLIIVVVNVTIICCEYRMRIRFYDFIHDSQHLTNTQKDLLITEFFSKETMK